MLRARLRRLGVQGVPDLLRIPNLDRVVRNAGEPLAIWAEDDEVTAALDRSDVRGRLRSQIQ
jgi:hypothetical protein